MKEKRKYIRIASRKPLKVKFRVVSHKERKQALKKGKTSPKNISGGGMFIEMPPMKPGVIQGLSSGKNKIILEFNIPGYRPKIKIVGSAAWFDKKEDCRNKGCGVGIQFEEIQEQDKERLLQYMLHMILH